MFLQIHTLVSYPASLLNRDDAGLAKRIPFGNATRLRVSSQCLKRHWRDELSQHLSDLPDGYRTRHLFERRILSHLVENGIDNDVSTTVAATMKDVMLSGKADGASDITDEGAEGRKDGKTRSQKGKSVESDLQLKQAVYFSLPEISYLQSVALEAARQSVAAKDAEGCVREALTGERDKPKKLASKKKQTLMDNFQAMLKSAGYGNAGQSLTAALFGRFVTSDLLARVDAPVHVAHAFTVHGANTEMDYFTVVDDLNRDDESGAAHANQSELGAGVYYGHVVVDVPLLVSNLSGIETKDWRSATEDAPRRVLDALVRSIATRSPGAKLGATAPYGRADLVILEVGVDQPRTLANAFLEAMAPRGHMLQEAANRLAAQLKRIDAMYGATAGTRTLATTLEASAFAPLPVQSLDEATHGALDAVWA